MSVLLGLSAEALFPSTIAFAAAASSTVKTPMVSATSAVVPPGPSAVAQARGTSVALYRSPSSKTSYGVFQGAVKSDGPLIFLVSSLSLSPDWVQIYLPIRPNGSKAWVRESALLLSSDSYFVSVDRSAHKLVVFDGSRKIITASVGVGRSALPTPTGTYFLAQLFKQPNAGGEYGPYAFGLSGFSNVLQSFGGGPGEIGLHGTNEPTSVGADVSHGCLRVSNAMITRLAHLLPLGTPVKIIG